MNLAEIQQALRDEQLDGWLFFDHHLRDPLAYRILGFTAPRTPTRRWYYFIPAEGEPRRLVHAVESHMLDALPGSLALYASWELLTVGVRTLLAGARRIAMQYSPHCAVPYVAMVDAGTVEMVRAQGVEVFTSANLVQYFEARWDQQKLESHIEAGKLVDGIRRAAFDEIGTALRGRAPINEFDVKTFILRSFEREGLFTDHGPIVAVNRNASDPHYEPSAERHEFIQQDDLVLIDLWAKFDKPGAVYYDVTWTGVPGRPSSEIENVFAIVTGARDAAIGRVRNAVAQGQPLQGYEVDDAARSFIAERGYGKQFVHRTGHSIGEEVHGSGANMDNLETHDERRVIPWTCFSIEPGVYLEDFGIRSEVDMFVGETEAIVTGEKQEKLVSI